MEDLERCIAALEADKDRDVRYYVGVATDRPVPLTPGATTGQIVPQAAPQDTEEAGEPTPDTPAASLEADMDAAAASTTDDQDASAPVALPAETSTEAAQDRDGDGDGDGNADEDESGSTTPAAVDDVDEAADAEPCPEVEGVTDEGSTSAPAVVDVAGGETAPSEAAEGGEDGTTES